MGFLYIKAELFKVIQSLHPCTNEGRPARTTHSASTLVAARLLTKV